MAFYPGCPATFGGNMINNVLNAMQSFLVFFLEALTLTFLVISDLLDSWASRILPRPLLSLRVCMPL